MREEELEKLELNKSYPDLLIKLIDAAQERARAEVEGLKRARTVASKLIGLAKKIESGRPILPVSGVDGSLVTFRWFGGRKLVVYGVSSVVIKEEPDVKVFVGIDEVPREGSPEAIMMLAESSAVREACRRAGGGAVILDGPIVDPPSLTDEDYIAKRCEKLAEAIKAGCEVIGFIKRYLSDILPESSEGFSDWEIAPLALKEAASKVGLPVILGPFESSIVVSTAKIYEKYLGVKLHRVFVLYRGASRPYAVEFLADNPEEKLSDIIATLEATAYPPNGMPLPVILAHRTSLVRRRAARKILREALTQMASEAPEIHTLLEDVVGVEE